MMAGISSKALNFGDPVNKEKTFQGQRFDDEFNLNWVQFKWRNHDSQIGRFIEIDPLSEKYEYNSTYAFSENKVTSHVELEGLEAASIIVSGSNCNCDASDIAKGYNQGLDRGMPVVAAVWGSYMTLGLTSTLTGVSISTLFKFGATGATVNAGFSALQGESGYEIFKSAVSGFISGSVLGGLGATSGVLTAGTASGIAGETTNQVLDNMFGKGSGFDLKKIAASGLIGALANVVSSSVINKVNSILDQKLASEIASTQTSAYRETIKAAIKQDAPNIGNRALGKAINQRIRQVQQLLRNQTNLEKAAVKTAVERSIDYMQDQANKIPH
ncbi:MAG TPA: hypothetical protein VFV31_01210 [Chitinophagaceae bacterium]|nr:hypothetical protein [Chitinophagaceae bacterium]